MDIELLIQEAAQSLSQFNEIIKEIKKQLPKKSNKKFQEHANQAVAKRNLRRFKK